MTIIRYMLPEIWSGPDIIFLLSCTIFCPFIPLTAQKKIQKIEKISWRYHLTQVYQKSWSYALLFLRYGASQMWLFFMLAYFFPFYHPLPTTPPLNSLKNKNFKKMKKKKHLDKSSFHTSVPKSWTYAILFLRYGAWQM